MTGSPRYRLGIDVGGTFTDAWIIDEATGQARVAKQSTTANPIDGILRLLEEQNIHPSEMSLLLHGTTVATNARALGRGCGTRRPHDHGPKHRHDCRLLRQLVRER